MNIERKQMKYVAIAALLFIIYFLFRNTLLYFFFERAEKRIEEKYRVNLSVSDVRFSSFDCIALKNFSIKPVDADTLLQVNEAELNLSLFDLLTGKIGFDEVKINDGTITVHNEIENSNIRFLKAVNKSGAPKATSPLNFFETANTLTAKMFRVLHTSFSVKNVSLTYSDTGSTQNVFIPEMNYDLKKISGCIINKLSNDTISLSGNVVEKNKRYQFQITQTANNSYLPFLNAVHGLKCKFKSIAVNVSLQKKGNGFEVSTDVEAENFFLNHWRLAKEDVVFSNSTFKGVWKISTQSIELDSASVIQLQKISVHPYLFYSNSPQEIFSLSIAMPETVSDTFFNSLPGGMFHTVKGISCTGTLAYDLKFDINTQQPDSLTFLSALKRKNFRINHYGEETFERINSSFTYNAYDGERLVRQIIVGEENPEFVSLTRINPYLVHSVLQSEDPSFMLHRGFLPEAFRESIIKNYKEKRFARGGSTISMQLVKNVFLNRNKTISRKAEEALIVYLIENLSLVSKERMLEIYLNVIEWGPNVYGIYEAARFYFNKNPQQLNLQESIFLASLIPHPKFFKYQFDKAGNIRPTLNDYFRILSQRMLYKGWLTANDTIGLKADVKLKGAALHFILPNDSLAVPLNEEEEMLE